MTWLLQFDAIAAAQLPARPLHLAIGMFDGVHLGHRAVIEVAVAEAKKVGGVSGVLTFWPHPSALFRPEHPTRLIQDPATKARVLTSLQLDALITEPFTPAFAALPAQGFLGWLKQRLPNLAAVYVGENFRFGQGRRGDVTLLVAEGRQLGIPVFSAPRVTHGGQPISSTRIRAQLETGDVEAANELLGYRYFAHGVVAGGKRLGRTLGFPTLNLAWTPPLCPRFGVYAVRVRGNKSRESLPGVANFGLRPTVEHTTQPRLEVHVLGACPYDEGDAIAVEWLRFLRAEMKFSGVAELTAQIARDRAAAEGYFAGQRAAD